MEDPGSRIHSVDLDKETKAEPSLARERKSSIQPVLGSLREEESSSSEDYRANAQKLLLTGRCRI